MKVKSIIYLVATLALISVGVYYFLPGDYKFGGSPPEPGYFDFKVISKDLGPDLIERYTNNFEKAKASLEDRPDQLDGWLALGLAKKHVGDYRGAEEAWIKAGEIRPLNSTSFGNLSDLYVNFLKEYDKAIPAFETAIANSAGEAKNINFYRNYYYFYLYNLADPAKAEEILLRAVQDNPGHVDSYSMLGNFYQTQGEIEKAIANYEKALEINPDSYGISRELNNLKNL